MEWLALDGKTYNAISAILGLAQLSAIIFAGWSIRQQATQIKKLHEQVDLQTEAVILQGERIFITSFTTFSQMYQQLMRDLPKSDATKIDIEAWWYRYWDLLIAEATFCARGYLDKTIFKIWITELIRNFDKCPHGATYMGTFEQTLDQHVGRVATQHTGLKVFFGTIRDIHSKHTLEQGRLIENLINTTYRSIERVN